MTDRSYRRGNLIVLGAVLGALVICLAVAVLRPTPAARAGRDLGDSGFPLGPFRLTERSGRGVTEADFADGVAVGSFIFTRCPLSCPRITSVMKGLQGRFADTGVRLFSVSVDPDHDRPAVLADYARRFGAEGDRWWFLTGDAEEVRRVVTGQFKLSLAATTEGDREAGAEAFSHSSRLALVDRGKVAGYYDSTDPKEVEALVAEARRRSGPMAPAWARRLPPVNAGLNGACAALLALGWVMIRTDRWRAHAACMISAVVVSTVFLACYLVYHFQVGSVPYRGTGPLRLTYFTILLSHTALATFGVVPLVTLTLWHALRRRWERHARLARVTFPIWMYVSVTGVVIYLMLYRMAPAAN